MAEGQYLRCPKAAAPLCCGAHHAARSESATPLWSSTARNWSMGLSRGAPGDRNRRRITVCHIATFPDQANGRRSAATSAKASVPLISLAIWAAIILAVPIMPSLTARVPTPRQPATASRWKCRAVPRRALLRGQLNTSVRHAERARRSWPIGDASRTIERRTSARKLL